MLHVAPMYHAADLTMMVVGGTQVGGTHVILPGFAPDAVLDALEQHRVNVFFGVPTMYQLLLRYPALAERDLSDWRVGVFGAAPMPASAVEAMLEALPHVELIQACGQMKGPAGFTPPPTRSVHVPTRAGVARCSALKRGSSTPTAMTSTPAVSEN
jgi:acyl-CoA synthetase (AMP-forming)/AMP-acid ligase II